MSGECRIRTRVLNQNGNEETAEMRLNKLFPVGFCDKSKISKGKDKT